MISKKTIERQSKRDFIPITRKAPGQPDIAGVGSLKQDVERINNRMEVVIYALFIAFIVALISVFGIFIDAYKFHSESYQEFRKVLLDQQKYNQDYQELQASVNKLIKQIREINFILKIK